MTMTIQQKVASFQLSYSMCMASQLKRKEKPKTAIWNRLDQLEDYMGRALDHYRVEHFRAADLRRASKLFDKLDVEIASLYPTDQRKRQIRRQKRHNRSRIERPIRRAHK